jgi:hypothetical protein
MTDTTSRDGNIAIYFALAYTQHQINRIVSSHIKKHLIINITSNYKTNVEQLQGRSGIRDK